jgi:hypothetical protein
MQPVDVIGGQLRVAGVVDLEPTEAGIVLHRMPAWARVQHNDITLGLLEQMPTGGRLELVTDASVLELDVQLTLLQIGDGPEPTAVFDVVVDGELVDSQSSGVGTTIVTRPPSQDVDIVPGGPTTIRFELPAGPHRVEVWLPQAAVVTLMAVRADGEVSPPPPSDARRWTHYGSSISHCLEADRPTGAWPAVAARLAGVDLQSFAFAGQCHLDPFAARMVAAQPADLISLKLGINVVNADSFRERTFLPVLHGFLDTVRERHPTVPLMVVTPITCPVAEDHPGPTSTVDGRCTVVERPESLATGALTLRRIRELEREAVSSRQATDPNLHLLEGPELFGPDDLADLPDGLHPNAAGYRRMGERFHAVAFGPGGPFAAR